MQLIDAVKIERALAEGDERKALFLIGQAIDEQELERSVYDTYEERERR